MVSAREAGDNWDDGKKKGSPSVLPQACREEDDSINLKTRACPRENFLPFMEFCSKLFRTMAGLSLSTQCPTHHPQRRFYSFMRPC
jgi:hypothetical protein